MMIGYARARRRPLAVLYILLIGCSETDSQSPPEPLPTVPEVRADFIHLGPGCDPARVEEVLSIGLPPLGKCAKAAGKKGLAPGKVALTVQESEVTRVRADMATKQMSECVEYKVRLLRTHPHDSCRVEFNVEFDGAPEPTPPTSPP